MSEIQCCVNCGTNLERQYGLPGVVCTCPKCGKRWVKCLGKLVNEEELHQRAEKEQ